LVERFFNKIKECRRIAIRYGKLVGLTTHDDMDVRVVRIPVIDSDSIEPGAEIPLGLGHQVPGQCPQI